MRVYPNDTEEYHRKRKPGVPRHSYSNFVSACRSAIWPEGSDGMVHHHAIISFRQIVDEFLDSTGIDPRDVYFITRGRFVWFLDNELEKEFVAFHKGRAVLVKMTKEQHRALRKKPACAKWVPLDLQVKMNNVKREYPHEFDRYIKKYSSMRLETIREMAKQKMGADR